MIFEENKLLLQRVYHWEKERGKEIYLTQPMGDGKVEDFNWERVVDEARRMAGYLKAQNFPEKSQISILSKNCAHFIMSDLAIWMAGHVSVALYPTLNAETVNYILTHSDSKLLFVGKLDGWEGMKPGVPDGLPCVSYPLSPPNDYPTWNDITLKTEPIEGRPTRPGEDLGILIYTSGSTGQPKGVMLSFDNMSFAGWNFGEVLKIGTQDRMLSYLPLAHSFERAALQSLSLCHGCRVFFAESLDTFAQDLRRATPTVFQSVPRLWLKFQQGVFKKLPEKKLRLFLKIPILSSIIRKKVLTGLGLQHTRMAASGSAPIPASLIEWYRNLGLELLEGYGMSENFAYSHVSLPGRTRAGYVGEPMPGVEVKISEEGEILVKSPATMVGYFKEPEKTKECFTEEGFLKTGDRGEVDELNRLKITGRVKELFKTSKGKYIAPVPIENMINADSYIELSCVAGAGQPQPYAVVQLAEELRKKLSDPSVKAEVVDHLKKLVDDINKKVEHHEALEFLAIAQDEWGIENGFLTPTMKIKRNILENTYGPKVEKWYDSKEKVILE